MFRNRLFEPWCQADQQHAHRSPSAKPDTKLVKVFVSLISSMDLLVIQGVFWKTWNTHECQVETNSGTAGALFYTAFFFDISHLEF